MREFLTLVKLVFVLFVMVSVAEAGERLKVPTDNGVLGKSWEGTPPDLEERKKEVGKSWEGTPPDLEERKKEILEGEIRKEIQKLKSLYL